MDSNYTDLGYVEETVIGTTPGSALKRLRRTGGSVQPMMGTTRSNEIRSDLRGGPPIRTSRGVRGQIPVEWSYGTFDDLLEGMLFNDWAANNLEDGTTKKHYTFEDQFQDPVISPDQFISAKGCRLGSLSMSLALDSVVTGGFSFMGCVPAIAQATVGTGAPVAPTTTEPFNCVDMVSILREDSATIEKLVGVDLLFQRSLRPKRELGSLHPFDIGAGRLLITGTLTQYFEDDTLLDAWFAFTERALELQLTDPAGNDLLFHLPRIKYVGDPEITNPGPDSDRYVRVNFEAFADADDDFKVKVTRTPA